MVEQQQLIHGCKVARGALLVSHLLITYDNFFLFKAATSGDLCCEIIVAPIWANFWIACQFPEIMNLF